METQSSRSVIFFVGGLSYGDEGKGTTVEALAAKYEAQLVVRFGGGPQAAHHVVREDGKWHCFSQFGSATLLPGVCTYISRFMLIEPMNLLRENEALIKLDVHDALQRIFLDEECVIVTPWHKLLGQLHELKRTAHEKHGTTGLGVGIAALEVEQSASDTGQPAVQLLRLCDCRDVSTLREKVIRHIQQKISAARSLIKEYRASATCDSTVASTLEQHLFDAIAHSTTDQLVQQYTSFFQTQQEQIVKRDFLISHLQRGSTIIFEGSQGALLDRHHGFYPHVTKTTCTFRNAQQLLDETKILTAAPLKVEKVF